MPELQEPIIDVYTRDQLEEDLTAIEDQGKLDKEEKEKVSKEAFKQVLTRFGAFIDYDHPRIKRMFPGLTTENFRDYSLEDAKISIFILPSEIQVGDDEFMTFQQFAMVTDYDKFESDDVYNSIGGYITGKGEKMRLAEDKNVILVDRSERSLIVIREPYNLETPEGLISLQQSLRHELAHALLVADNVPIPMLKEGLVEYSAFTSSIPGTDIHPSYQPAFEFVLNLVNYLKTQGLDRSLLARAYVRHERSAALQMGDVINKMLTQAGIDPQEAYTKMYDLYLDKKAEAYTYLNEINQKLTKAAQNPS